MPSKSILCNIFIGFKSTAALQLNYSPKSRQNNLLITLIYMNSYLKGLQIIYAPKIIFNCYKLFVKLYYNYVFFFIFRCI